MVSNFLGASLRWKSAARRSHLCNVDIDEHVNAIEDLQGSRELIEGNEALGVDIRLVELEPELARELDLTNDGQGDEAAPRAALVAGARGRVASAQSRAGATRRAGAGVLAVMSFNAGTWRPASAAAAIDARLVAGAAVIARARAGRGSGGRRGFGLSRALVGSVDGSGRRGLGGRLRLRAGVGRAGAGEQRRRDGSGEHPEP